MFCLISPARLSRAASTRRRKQSSNSQSEPIRVTLPQVRLVKRDRGHDRSLKSSRQTVNGWSRGSSPSSQRRRRDGRDVFFDLQCVYTERREREMEGRESKDMNGAIVWNVCVCLCVTKQTVQLLSCERLALHQDLVNKEIAVLVSNHQ